MKATPSTIIDAPLYYNGVKEHRNTEKCIILRDLGVENDTITLSSNLRLIPENTSVIDFTNNNFYKLPPLGSNSDCHTLLLSRNLISQVDCEELPRNLQNLQLSFNKISSLSQIINWTNCPKTLVNLTLRGNELCFKENYRLYIIAIFPHLKILDFKKISDAERASSKNIDLSSVSSDKKHNNAILSSVDKEVDMMKRVASKMDEITRAELQQQLANATTLDEIDRLEKILSGGV